MFMKRANSTAVPKSNSVQNLTLKNDLKEAIIQGRKSPNNLTRIPYLIDQSVEI